MGKVCHCLLNMQITSTMTTLAAFLPLMFWPGVVGEFMKFLPLTLIATLLASLMMALIFVPTLGALFGTPGGGGNAERIQMISGGDGIRLEDVSGFTGSYLKILGIALNHPGKILVSAVLLLVGVQGAYANFGRGVEFFPKVEPDFAKLQVRARGNLSIHEKDTLMKEVEARILDMKELETIYARTGQEQNSQEAEDIIGNISLEFIDWKLRRNASKILSEISSRTQKLAGIFVDPREQESGPPVGKPVQIHLISRHYSLLGPAVEILLKGLPAIGGLTNIVDSRPLPGIDWQIKVDRAQASKFGADVSLIGKSVQLVSAGIKLGEYRPDDTDGEVDIRIRYPIQYRTLEELDNIRINTEKGRVPIGNFIVRKAEPRIGTINRTDGRREITIKTDVEDGVQVNSKIQQIQKWLNGAGIDPRVKVIFKGENEEQNKAEEFLVRAFGIALFIMAIILVTQFNSFYSAFLILSAVIMSTNGVFIGLLITEQPFGIVMGGIGVIALAGIVVNNNIVLIDTFDRLTNDIEDAASMRNVILRTGAQRLRPVILTSITTILGLLPMVLALNIDFVTREVTQGAPSTQWWRQLSTAIVFGLGFATVLTLIVTPSALMFRANLKVLFKNRKWIFTG